MKELLFLGILGMLVHLATKLITAWQKHKKEFDIKAFFLCHLKNLILSLLVIFAYSKYGDIFILYILEIQNVPHEIVCLFAIPVGYMSDSLARKLLVKFRVNVDSKIENI